MIQYLAKVGTLSEKQEAKWVEWNIEYISQTQNEIADGLAKKVAGKDLWKELSFPYEVLTRPTCEEQGKNLWI